MAPGDLRDQLTHALRSTARGLAGAGASFSDVVRLRFFVTDRQPEKYADLIAGIDDGTEELGLPSPLPPLSAIGVDYVFEPDVPIEVDAYAVLD